jgi:hypothetical protein
MKAHFMSDSDHKPSRIELERRWLNRVQRAEDRYILAASQFQKAIKEQRDGMTPAPDGMFALRKARSRESATRLEYLRVLRIFTDLTAHGKSARNSWRANGRRRKRFPRPL